MLDVKCHNAQQTDYNHYVIKPSNYTSLFQLLSIYIVRFGTTATSHLLRMVVFGLMNVYANVQFGDNSAESTILLYI